MQIPAILTFCACLGVAAAHANDPPKAATLDRTVSFEQAYAASFYEFDACGDRLAGRIYRRALTEKVTRCPFSTDAQARFRSRSALMRAKSSDLLEKLIEDQGGLPVRLDGMTRTCHEQISSPEYRAVRDRLLDYAAGRAAGDTVVAEPCDAATIAP